jgi:phosphoserine phosphatase RsbU/P
VQGSDQQTLSLNHAPYTVGRKVDRDLVIPDPRVSREHASIISENGEFFIVDEGSKLGTFVNGERVERRKLQRNDRCFWGHGSFALRKMRRTVPRLIRRFSSSRSFSVR